MNRAVAVADISGDKSGLPTPDGSREKIEAQGADIQNMKTNCRLGLVLFEWSRRRLN